ncbi:hypothetical protein BDFB_011775, partial [Asbolus verrucosus]
MSAISIYEEYVKRTKIVNYVLTYRFSQDHLELFFCRATDDISPYPQSLGISTIHNSRNSNEDATCITDTNQPPAVLPELNIGLSLLSDNVVSYISGFVVRTVLKKLTCDTCIMSLYSHNDEDLPEMKLIKLKTE